MTRSTGTYQTTVVGGESVRAFIPRPLPPADPPLLIEGELAEVYADAMGAIGRLSTPFTGSESLER